MEHSFLLPCVQKTGVFLTRDTLTLCAVHTRARRWARVLEMRDVRVGVEGDGDAAWGRLVWAALAVARLAREESALGGWLD